jgi:hypothetical protein
MNCVTRLPVSNFDIATMTSRKLPEELLQQIMWCLKLDVYSANSVDDSLAKRTTLLSCMTANRILYRLAELVLYHSINQHELTRLVQCFIRRPRLAGYVRELRDRETESHKRSTGGMSDIDAWREENFGINELWGRPHVIPPIRLMLHMCTRLETLILERNDSDLTFPDGDYLTGCTELNLKSQASLETPLGTLRTFVMQLGSRYQDHTSEFDDSWLPGLMFLPNIERIQIAELKIYDFELPDSTSNLRSLTIGSSTRDGIGTGYSYQFPVSIILERLLVKCPLLQHLDLTFHSDPNQGDDYWDLPGYMLSNHGSSLRALHLRNPYEARKPANKGKPMNLATMTNLQILTLPVDAILSSRCSSRSTSASVPERQPGRIDGEYASSLIDDNSRDNDARSGDMPGLDEGSDPVSVFLTDVLPPNLTRLTIIDRMSLSIIVARLDWELGRVMLSPRFGRLEVIRLQRDQALTEHIMASDWAVQRQDGCWEVSRRT